MVRTTFCCRRPWNQTRGLDGENTHASFRHTHTRTYKQPNKVVSLTLCVCVCVCCRFSLNSELQDLSLVTVMGGGEEEHFEDFGENHGAELLEGGVEDQEEGPAEDGGPGALHTPEQITCSSLIMSPR